MEAKKIKYRDYCRNITKLKYDVLEVFDGDNNLIGTWTPANNGLPLHVGQLFKTCPTSVVNRLEGDVKKAKFQQLKQQIDVRHVQNVSDNSGIMACDTMSDSFSEQELFNCELCQKQKTEVYEVWEEGEERAVCRDCMTTKIPPKILKSVLKRSKLKTSQ